MKHIIFKWIVLPVLMLLGLAWMLFVCAIFLPDQKRFVEDMIIYLFGAS